jgi:creatinine amidohydrolase
MSSRPFVLSETHWKTVRETRYELAVLPWGATEAHNYHLPYGSDILHAEHIAAECARLAWERGARLIVLPAVPFGVNTGQLDIPLDINMNPSTQAAVLNDVVACLARQGIPRLCVFNAHGGNDFKPMLRELQPRYPAVFLCTLNWWQVVPDGGFFDEPGDHAGEMETSVLQAIAPALVLPLAEAGDGAARRFRPSGLRAGWAWAQRDWLRVTRDTGVGNPARATPEKGRRYLDALLPAIAGFFVELAACPLDALYE